MKKLVFVMFCIALALSIMSVSSPTVHAQDQQCPRDPGCGSTFPGTTMRCANLCISLGASTGDCLDDGNGCPQCNCWLW